MATVTTTTSTPVLGISCDRGYISSQNGKYNLGLVIINAINFLCVACQPWSASIPPQGWFYFVCVSGFWMALIDLLLGMCRIQDRFVRVVPWKLGLVIFSGIWCFFYLTASSAVTHYAINYQNRDGWYAATIFGFIATIVYGLICYYRYLDWKTSPVNTTVITQSTPA